MRNSIALHAHGRKQEWLKSSKLIMQFRLEYNKEFKENFINTLEQSLYFYQLKIKCASGEDINKYLHAQNKLKGKGNHKGEKD